MHRGQPREARKAFQVHKELRAYLNQVDFVELNKQEIEDYEGHIYYIANHEVIKPRFI